MSLDTAHHAAKRAAISLLTHLQQWLDR
jgi:hypothetical protein